MQNMLFRLKRSSRSSLQSQIREVLVSAIMGGQLPADERVPSSRDMASTLGVSRNTVMLAYQGLIDDGYLLARERSGYFVNGEIVKGQVTQTRRSRQDAASSPDWQSKLRVNPARQNNISKPYQWDSYPYPFIYGQIDHRHFPIADWRECSRQALGKRWLDDWTQDARDRDDPMLVEQIRARILPRRGIFADRSEILITMGAQNALYLLTSLLVSAKSRVGFEDPGYPDARNIFTLKTKQVDMLSVDENGLIIDERLHGCDFVFATPSHQFPTTVTMPLERRRALLKIASDHDIIVIEDDYEFETNYLSNPTPALKSLDDAGRVVYIGSLSKTLCPGLRLGFLVASKELIDEARALRRLMIRHPPINNQRIAALFLSQGYHDALINRLHRIYRKRWEEMRRALRQHLSGSSRTPSFGGTSFWVRGPDRLNADMLAEDALEQGIVIEPGRIYYGNQAGPQNYFRLGFSSISHEAIEPGIKKLSALIAQQR